MNPYQQNINIMKSFFRKPIILVYAIVSLASIFTSMISGFILFSANATTHIYQYFLNFIVGFLKELSPDINFDSVASAVRPQTSFSFNLDLMTVLIGVAFILFYVKSRSQNPYSTLKAPTIMFRVYAVISFVGSIIGFAFGILGVFAGIIIVSSVNPVPFFIWLLILAIPALSLVLVQGISIFIFSSSIKNNQNSIYLSNRGAAFFGVTSLIGAVFSICSLVATTVLFVNAGVDLTSVILADILSLVPVASSVILGIIALSYSAYIKNLSEGFVYDPTEQPIENIEPVAETLFCGKCGQPLGPDDYFCNHCGTPVKR